MAITTFPPLYLRRLAGALALDSATYEDIEADRRATLQAGLTVLLASVGEGVALRASGGLANLVLMSAVALTGWAAWALLTFEVGARLLPGANAQRRRRTAAHARLRGGPRSHRVSVARAGLMMPVLLISSGCCWRWSWRCGRRSIHPRLATGARWPVCLFGGLLTPAIIASRSAFLRRHDSLVVPVVGSRAPGGWC